ncbi:hypothetical protein BU23DRAFT_549486 [Bimuria novae-zelandiae CBS 107.79]|uniref:Ig-like domain-containing protein n=1 Tax=Bimuria novae-zelandiae CBS 107.79 TaxID=1447943 RepID=A0A6A5VM30_9PLEO|nr:hypothetical protein BU23DRAFT_549486 [Bimuria novae-zelandiae CBS 107.79]
MLFKIFTLFLAFAIATLAAPGALVEQDLRPCTLSVHVTERCTYDNDKHTPTKVSRANITSLLTPSMSAVPVPAGEVELPWVIKVISKNEKISGNLTVAHEDNHGREPLIPAFKNVFFGWQWVNPETNRHEIVVWDESKTEEGAKYGCKVEQPWSKNNTKCPYVGSPADERDVKLACFFKCRN